MKKTYLLQDISIPTTKQSEKFVILQENQHVDAMNDRIFRKTFSRRICRLLNLFIKKILLRLDSHYIDKLTMKSRFFYFDSEHFL